MKKLFIILILLSVQSSVASKKEAKKTVRKPSQIEVSKMNFKVVYGDKITRFDISKTMSGAKVEFSNNQGDKTSKDISKDDFKFLTEKVQGLKGPSNDLEFCDRNHIEVVAGKLKMLGCLGGNNSLAIELQELTNLLSILF